jgi:hypothetical protein
MMMACLKSLLRCGTEENKGNQDAQQESVFELNTPKVQGVQFTVSLPQAH